MARKGRQLVLRMYEVTNNEELAIIIKAYNGRQAVALALDYFEKLQSGMKNKASLHQKHFHVKPVEMEKG